MRQPPPGMKGMPKKPSETKTQYLDRVKGTGVRTPRDSGTGTPKPRVMGGPADKMGPVRGTAKGPAPMPAMKKGGMVKGKKK